jgi:hypothetical protein
VIEDIAGNIGNVSRQSMSKLILITFAARPIGFVGVDAFTGVVVADFLLRSIGSI